MSTAQFGATSTQQATASAANGPAPALEAVRDGIWAVGLRMPDERPSYSLAYLLADDRGGLHVIDPGWADAHNWELLVGAIGATGHRVRDVASVIVTHLHADHTGLAARLREESGSPVTLLDREQRAIDENAGQPRFADFESWGTPASERAAVASVASVPRDSPLDRADVLVVDGDLLEVPGRSLRALHTPGHTPGHLCLVEEDELILFTGDHLLPNVFAGVGIGGRAADPLGDFFASLARIQSMIDHEACPGHGYRFAGIPERCAATREHHLKRSAEVAAISEAAPGLSVWEVASRIEWSAGWSNLNPLHRVNALAQTEMHLAYLASREPEPGAS